MPLVVVTLDADGALLSYQGRRARVAAPAVEVVDTVGAGDAFTAGLLHHLHSTGHLGPRLPGLTLAHAEAAVRYGVEVAAATCAVRGADPPWAAGPRPATAVGPVRRVMPAPRQPGTETAHQPAQGTARRRRAV